MQLERISPSISLCTIGLDCAANRYAEIAQGASARALLVSPELVSTAYCIYAERPDTQRLPVIPVPGMPGYWWAVAGPEALIVGCED